MTSPTLAEKAAYFRGLAKASPGGPLAEIALRLASDAESNLVYKELPPHEFGSGCVRAYRVTWIDKSQPREANDR